MLSMKMLIQKSRYTGRYRLLDLDFHYEVIGRYVGTLIKKILNSYLQYFTPILQDNIQLTLV